MHKVGGVRGVRRAVRIAHLLAISVVGSDDTFAAEIEKLRDDAGDTFVHGLHGFDSRIDNPGVPDHVWIGKVKNDQIIIRHAREDLVGHFARAHFWLKIVGRDFGRRHKFAVFARERALDSAVKKVRHVRIFFRLGDAQLRFASCANEFA